MQEGRGVDSRGGRRRWLQLIAVLAAMVMIAASCGDDDDNGDGATGGNGDGNGGRSITIAFADERPYGFEGADGEPTGEAPTVAKAVLEEMGITDVDGELVDFDALISGLNAGRYDMVAAGMFITEDRASQALFSDPDYCGTNAFAVPEGNPAGLTDFESVTDAGVTLGVLSGAVEDGYAVDSGVPDSQLSRFDTTSDMVDALTTGRIDAFALTAITVREQTADLDGFEATEGFVPVIDGEEQLGCGGYVFSFDNKELRDEFNEILVEMRDNGELLALVEEFGFSAAEMDAAKGVTVEDLVGQPYDFGMNG